jgi:predicted O-linked N-acetylglucosamine transferase (SPINDLY family)
MQVEETRRNEPCPCGSGRRYKNCHGAASAPATVARGAAVSPALAARDQLAAGAIAEAERLARDAIARDENDADGWTVLGLSLEPAQPEAALAAWRKAIALAPQRPEPHFRVGDFHRRRGEHAAAIVAYETALASGLRHPVLLNNLAISLQSSHRLDEAVALYREALAAQPDLAAANANLGDALRLLGRDGEAATHYERALAVTPGAAALWVSLGLCRHTLGNAVEARGAFERALAAEPENAHALVNLAALFNAEQRFEDAQPLLEKALALQPGFAEAANLLLYVRQQLCDWRDLDRLFEEQRAALARPGAPPVTPHNLLALPYSPAELLQAARKWAASHAPRSEPMPRRRPSPVDGRLRIAYLGPDFRAHPLANLLTEVIESHDRSRFEVYAYSLATEDRSPAQARFAAAFDRFVDIRGESAEASARRIAADEIAVLFDTSGYVIGARSEIFALRPAPIQVNCIGFPGTLGSDCYDYILTDAFVTPPAQQVNFSERFMLLPHCYLPGDRKRAMAAVPSRADCGLPREGFVFCCFNGSYKILPAVFERWMRLLSAVPGSVLWLLGSNAQAAENLRYEAECRGVEPQRLVFAPRVPLPEHLARHALADLFLDTLPCNAHTTANDALYAGLPLITCAGETFASRVSGSQLRAIGLPELVTESLDDYEARALALARDRALLAAYRERLNANRGTAPLFDTASYTKALEALLLTACKAGGS